MAAGLGHDQPLHPLGDRQHLINAKPTAIPALFTVIASACLVKYAALFRRKSKVLPHRGRRRKLLLASWAQEPEQPLRQDKAKGGRDQKGRDSHVYKTGDGPAGIVGMQGREDHMPGKSGLDRDLSGLNVPDLADHHDIRVLPQDGAKG